LRLVAGAGAVVVIGSGHLLLDAGAAGDSAGVSRVCVWPSSLVVAEAGAAASGGAPSRAARFRCENTSAGSPGGNQRPCAICVPALV
jgi:hypothetical protein